MFDEKAPQLASSYANTVCEIFNTALVKRALGNQPKRTGDDCGGARPCWRSWRSFGATSPARPETSRFGGSSTGEPDKIVLFCKGYWTNEAAVDPSSRCAYKEPTVEPLVPTVKCLPPNRGFKIVALLLSRPIE